MDINALLGQIVVNGNSYQTVFFRPNVSILNGIQLINANVGVDNSECSSSDNGQNAENGKIECTESQQKIASDDEEDKSSDDSTRISTNSDDNNKETGKKQTTIQRIRHFREEYRCTLCPYTCTTEKAFVRHLRHCESNEYSIPEKLPVSCPVCGKDRPGKQILEMHMEKHKDNKYFCCDICSFRTVQLKKLIQHRRMHTGEKPHLCPFCSYRSSRRDNLRSHARRVHKQDELPCDTFTPRSMLISPSKSK